MEAKAVDLTPLREWLASLSRADSSENRTLRYLLSRADRCAGLEARTPAQQIVDALPDWGEVEALATLLLTPGLGVRALLRDLGSEIMGCTTRRTSEPY